MVDVGVAEDDGLDFARWKWKSAVPLASFGAFALEQAAIKEEAQIRRFDEMHRSGDSFGRPRKWVSAPQRR